ncbi:hypothetical protein [Massilia glaciei]|uniref:Uncharacterized protein n=1 Tax=Massilia glaciei TaxID=1524097 RepID=A0A2U2HNR8_9BURK|nr:hypothetical protein [Massilia glaciei]PWF49055.1 hypothetical protein C7C56_008610 [Massilia glaciei]
MTNSIELLAYGDWRSVAAETRDRLTEFRFREAGRQRLGYVRVEVPLALARQAGHADLARWFDDNGIAFLIVGSSAERVTLRLGCQD